MDWQPIETAPKDHGRLILVHSSVWGTYTGHWDEYETAWKVMHYGCPAAQPSHWMPLPEPPKRKIPVEGL